MIESPLHPLNGRFKLFLHSNFPIHNIRGKPNVLSCKLDMMNFDCPCLFSPPQTISTNQHVFVESATGGYFLLREETSILVVPSCTSQGGIACGKVGWMPRCSHIFARPVFCPWPAVLSLSPEASRARADVRWASAPVVIRDALGAAKVLGQEVQLVHGRLERQLVETLLGWAGWLKRDVERRQG